MKRTTISRIVQFNNLFKLESFNRQCTAYLLPTNDQYFVRPHSGCLKKKVTYRMLLEPKNPNRNGVLWGVKIHFNVSVMLFCVLHNEIGRTSNSFITHMTLECHKVNASTCIFSLNLRAPILKCQCWSNFHIGILLHIEENCWSGIFELLSSSQKDTFIWSNEIASFTVFRNGPHKHIFRTNLAFKVMTMMRRKVQHTFELLVLESPPDLFKLLALWFQRDWWKNFRFLAKTFQPPICQLTYCLPIETSFKHTDFKGLK